MCLSVGQFDTFLALLDVKFVRTQCEENTLVRNNCQTDLPRYTLPIPDGTSLYIELPLHNTSLRCQRILLKDSFDL